MLPVCFTVPLVEFGHQNSSVTIASPKVVGLNMIVVGHVDTERSLCYHWGLSPSTVLFPFSPVDIRANELL